MEAVVRPPDTDEVFDADLVSPLPDSSFEEFTKSIAPRLVFVFWASCAL
jgi:hypothetical protein